MPEQAVATSLTMTVYNPALLKKEDLIRGGVARQELLDRLLDDLRREGPAAAPQHHLLIGQSGFGKTTLLRRLAYAMEDDPALAATWMPLVFPEEQYNVASLGDFWLNCADALSDALDRNGEQAASQALDARVRSVPADRAGRSAAALEILIAEADRLQRRLLLLVDNLDILLERLDPAQEWEFRRVISEERRLHFIGTSSRVLEAFYEHGRAFYDFFQIHELKGLDDGETFTLLCKLAEQAGKPDVEKLLKEQPGRIRTPRLLTGGNPRTLVLLFKVLAEGGDSDVQRDVEQLLDLYTPLYKARFEELPAQAQQLVDAMAIHWDPLTAADLTGLLRPLSVNLVSAQLKRLEDLGVVEKAPWYGEKRTAFQIGERFFNIWYLMRARRRVRQKLLWLVKFLEAWFDREELGARARGLLEAAHVNTRALQIDPKRSGDLESIVRICERLGETPKDLPAAITLLRQALESVPDDRDAQSALAQLLTLAGRWPEAAPLLEQLTAGETFSTGLLQAVVKSGHVGEALAIFERTGADQRCRPLYEALRAVEAGTPDYLRRVAPEVRTVAMEALREIAPDLLDAKRHPAIS